MISGVDIEAWREDEIQTEFLNRQRRLADNHIGWVVQIFTTEWESLNKLFETREEAVQHYDFLRWFTPQFEFRVYELVKEKL